jgi:type II secretory pathway pseudopilin PulG
MSTSTRSMRLAVGRTRAQAFTIAEMLAVVVIFVILVVIAVPSFQGMLRSNEEAQAENVLRQAIRAGRDVAVRSAAGADSGLVFTFGAEGRVAMVPCVRVGVLNDATGSNSIEREVFVPAAGATIFQLPKGWMVRAFASRTLRTQADIRNDDGWYNTQGFGGQYASRLDDNANARGNWVAPETAYVNVDTADHGPARSSFMVRFEGRTGLVRTTPSRGALVLSPVMSIAALTGAGFGADAAQALSDLSALDPARYAQTVLSGSVPGAGSFTAEQRRSLLGRLSTDMLLVKPVIQLALYDERLLASGLGVRLDSERPSVVVSADGEPVGTIGGGELVAGLTATRINAWIEGDVDGVGGTTANDRPVAKLFMVDRYSSNLRQVNLQLEVLQ